LRRPFPESAARIAAPVRLATIGLIPAGPTSVGAIEKLSISIGPSRLCNLSATPPPSQRISAGSLRQFSPLAAGFVQQQRRMPARSAARPITSTSLPLEPCDNRCVPEVCVPLSEACCQIPWGARCKRRNFRRLSPAIGQQPTHRPQDETIRGRPGSTVTIFPPGPDPEMECRWCTNP